MAVRGSEQIRFRRDDSVTDHLFVYGTLRSEGGAPGGVSGLLDERAEKVGTGEIVGRLYEAGPYPAAVPADGDRVRGEVYRLEAPGRSLPVLDRYEGCAPDGEGLYRREEVEVEMDDGATLRAWTYFYNRETSSLEEIPSGDYLERTRDPSG